MSVRLHKVAEAKPPRASGLSPESSESRDAEKVRQAGTVWGARWCSVMFWSFLTNVRAELGSHVKNPRHVQGDLVN